MQNESKLTLTQSCELTLIFQAMDLETLETYAGDLKHRMNMCAINFIEGGPFVEKDTYQEMKEICGRVENALVNKQVNIM
jgi:hypothetical protein